MAETKVATPKVSTLTTLWYSTSLTGEKTQIAYVQSIPSLKEPKEAQSYNALDMESERQAKGKRPSGTLEIEVLYTETQHKTIKGLSDSDDSYYIFVKYPTSTKANETDSLVMYFTAQVDLGNAPIEIDDMLKDTITLYKNSEVSESYGFPTA